MPPLSARAAAGRSATSIGTAMRSGCNSGRRWSAHVAKNPSIPEEGRGHRREQAGGTGTDPSSDAGSADRPTESSCSDRSTGARGSHATLWRGAWPS